MTENNEKVDFKVSLIIFWVLAAVMMFVELGTTMLWGSEDRWAEISRIMLLSGDWFHPSINGEIYFDKPLLSYWLIAVPGLITGGINEFIVRLPSALSGLAGLWATYMLGKKLWNRQVGIFAAWILLTALGFVFWSRKGAADMENMSAIILAVTWYFYCKDKAGFFSYFLFFFICIVGAHTKGLPAIAVPLLVIIPDLIRNSNWKKHLKISFFAAAIICAGLYFVPFIIAAKASLPAGWEYPQNQLTGLELVWRENIVRAFHSYDHNDEMFFSYLYHVPRLMLPWTILLVVGLIAMIPRYKKLEAKNRWLLEAMLLILLLFTASGSKRWYYILPIVPFCSLFCGVFVFEELRENWKHWTYLVYKYVSVICGGILLLTIPIYRVAIILSSYAVDMDSWLPKPLGTLYDLQISIVWQIILTVMGLIVLLPWILAKGNKTEKYMGWMFRENKCLKWAPLLLSIWAAVFSFFCIFPSSIEHYRTERAFAKEFAALLKKRGVGPEKVAFFRKPSALTIFYAQLDKPVEVFVDEKKDGKIITAKEKMTAFLKRNGKKGLIICQERYTEEMNKMVPKGKAAESLVWEKTFPWDELKKDKSRKNMAVYHIVKEQEIGR